jgi:hypothetical protein
MNWRKGKLKNNGYWLGRALLACCLVASLSACKRRDGDDTTLGSRPPPANETHATFTFAEIPKPESGNAPGRPAMTLRIPREYVWFENVLSRNGYAETVPLRIELPGPMPWQERPSLNGKKGTPEYDEFMKGWIGKFIVTVGSGSGNGGRKLFLHALGSGEKKQDGSSGSVVLDGEIYGLVRYSPVKCFSAEHLKQPNLKAFLDAKPPDDPRPEPNCRLDRGSATYFSPAAVTNADEVVFIECRSTQNNCRVNFDFERHGISTDFDHAKVPRWAEIVNPTRELVRSFIVRSVSPAVAASASR